MIELNSLQQTLGVSFEDVSHLQQALIHRSYLNETSDNSLQSNERLEFLGDACLGLVVTEKLYHDFPDLQEGDLTEFRSALVQTGSLAQVADSLSLGECLHLGRGEDESGGRQKRRNLAGTLEAVIGAILIDQGFDTAKKFILRILEDRFKPDMIESLQKDPKSRLQEITQSQNQQVPVYKIVSSAGPDHEKVFTAEVFLEEVIIGSGSGNSKQRAEKLAAKSALEKLEGEFLV